MTNYENTSDFFGISNLIEKIEIERKKDFDNAVLGVIEKIATDYGIKTKVILNEKAIVEALTEYAEKHKGNFCTDKQNNLVHCEGCHQGDCDG